jgi:CxxC-x17-CxxC domain-containing protein
MHNAICSNCGKECEVPFKPTGAKPVFCRECFQNNRTDQDSREQDFRERRDFSNRRENPSRPVESNNNQQFENLNAKLDIILNLLETKNTPKIAPKKEQAKEFITSVEEVAKEPVIETTKEGVVENIAPPVIKKKRVVKITSEIK